MHDLGDRQYLLLHNHGLLTVGPSVSEAFLAMYLFETTCNIQVRAQSGGGELRTIRGDVIGTAKAQAKAATNGKGGDLLWPGLLRRLDRQDPSYRA